jgi:tRNA threonylcarbamoyladenosine biosynthesis protein TsaB
VILGLDTATPSTAVAAWAPGGPAVELRDDPAPGRRPAHAGRLLVLLEEALERAGAGWDDVERLAVGVGPGGFTGLRLGIATARALAQARGLPLAGVSSLEALAAGAAPATAAGAAPATAAGAAPTTAAGAAPATAAGAAPATPRGVPAAAAGAPPAAPERPVLAVLDARPGEVFAGAWTAGARVLEPVAIAPEALAERIGGAGALHGPLAVGDGAVRFREVLARAGADIPPDGDAAHRLSALAICRLGAAGAATDRNALLPDYRREPDAKPPKLPSLQ